MSINTEIFMFLRRTKMPPTKFGRDCFNDPPIVAQIKAGRVLRPKHIEKARAFMAKWESK